MKTRCTVRPIQFSGRMVREIIAGRKTQTRRAVPFTAGYDDARHVESKVATSCAYGKPGDTLWVREAWRTGAKLDALNGTQTSGSRAPLWYEADKLCRPFSDSDVDAGGFGEPGRLRIARFMPRWASRLTLEIVSIRVQRLQDISEADIEAEGMKHPTFGYHGHGPSFIFRQVWDGLNAQKENCCWEDNPWVWALEFRRLEEGLAATAEVTK